MATTPMMPGQPRGQLPPVMATVLGTSVQGSSMRAAPGEAEILPGYTVPSYTPAPVVYAQGVQSLSYAPPQQLAYAGAPQMARGSSFVASPLQSASYVAQPPPGEQPVEGTLTKGLPDPAAVDQQRNAYSKALDMELQKSIQAIQERNASEKKMLAQAAQQQKAMYELQVDQMVQGQSAVLDEQRNMQLLGLQQEAMNQKIGLENQAAGLKLEYEQRKAQEEMMFKQYELQKVYYESERKLVQQQQAIGQQPSAVPPPLPGAMYGLPSGLPSIAAPVALPQPPMPGMMVQGSVQAPQTSMETVRSLPFMQTVGALPGMPPQMVAEQAQMAAPLSYAVPAQGAPMMYMQQTPSYVAPAAA